MPTKVNAQDNMANPLKEYKERNRKSLNDLVKMTGLSATAINNILHRDQDGIGFFRQSTHVLIKKRLGVDLDPKVEIIIKE